MEVATTSGNAQNHGRFRGILTGLLLASTAAARAVAPAHVTYCSDPRTEVTIGWRTATQAASTVQYGPTTTYGQTETGTPFQTGGAWQHHVKLTGLTPGTTYHYLYEGADATFTTAPLDNEPFRFIVPGDIQGWNGLNPSWQGCAQWLGANQPAPFWVPVGDIVSVGQEQGQWDWMFRSSASVVQNSVMMPVQGNHECSAPGDGYEYPQFYMDQFRTPSNGSASFQDTYYAFEYSNALFVILLRHYRDPTEYPGAQAEQTPWLDSVLAASTKEWKFVFLHDPVYPAEWINCMDQHGVDIVFSGHTHQYGETYRGDTFLYSTAGFANSGTEKICVVDVAGTGLTVTTYNWQTGAVLSARELGTPMATRVALRTTGLVVRAQTPRPGISLSESTSNPVAYSVVRDLLGRTTRRRRLANGIFVINP
jgi:hypothetical protein